MTKTELIKAVADKANFTQKDVKEVLEIALETIKEDVANGNKVSLIGFGNFEVTERAAREGRNPQTGETMHIAASKSPKFKPGKAFKELVNA